VQFQVIPSLDEFIPLRYMGYKEDLSRLHDKVDKNFAELSEAIRRVTKVRRFSASKLILWLSVAGLLVAIVAWIEPRISSHISDDTRHEITSEVSQQLQEPKNQLNGMSADIAEIKGQLKILAPLINDAISKKIREAKNLPPTQVKSLVEVAHKGEIRLDNKDVSTGGEQMIARSNGDDPAAWDAALTFLNYKTFLNSAALNFLPRPNQNLTTEYAVNYPHGSQSPHFAVAGIVPKDKAAEFIANGKDLNEGKPSGNQYIFANGGAVILDNMKLKNVIFIGVFVQYNGGSLSMENVVFINCTFDVPHQPNGTSFARAVLSGTPSTNFAAS
jgi:hypothetical protein